MASRIAHEVLDGTKVHSGQDALRVENLTVYYNTPRGPGHAGEDISFSLHPQERLGLVGESGSGKSTMALTVMRLIKPPAQVMSGHVWLGDTDLMALRTGDETATPRRNRHGGARVHEFAEPGDARAHADQDGVAGPRHQALQVGAGAAHFRSAGHRGAEARSGEHVSPRVERRHEAARRVSPSPSASRRR